MLLRRFQVTMNIIFRLVYLSMCLLATCAATSWVKHRAVTEDAEYLFGCKVTKKFGVTFMLPGQVMMGGSHFSKYTRYYLAFDSAVRSVLVVY